MKKSRTWETQRLKSIIAKTPSRVTVIVNQMKSRNNKRKLSYKCFVCIIRRVKLLSTLISPNNFKSTKFIHHAWASHLTIILWDCLSRQRTFSLIWFSWVKCCSKLKVKGPNSLITGSAIWTLSYLPWCMCHLPKVCFIN